MFSGGNSDQGRAALGDNGGQDDVQTVTYTVVTTLAAPGTALLQCSKVAAGDVLLVAERKLTAIRVGSLVNTPATGP